MRSSPEEMIIERVIELKKKRLLLVNEEYQRGSVWNRRQEKLLIDSILRGYPIPQFYFHFIKTSAGGLTSESYEIIDGQQRINAIRNFVDNRFRLFDPQKDKRTGLPKFLSEQPCPWGGKTFESLSVELKEKFRTTPLRIARIETDDINEVRELFVRLQAGLPLNAQEKRDAWPGDFSQFVIKTAGKKPNVIGHDFFTKMVKGTGEKRGGLRQACAQIFMTFYARHHHGPLAFCNLNSQQIDEFYRHHLDFHPDDPGSMVWRFNRVLDKAYEILGDGKRPPLRVHSALHSILLIDSMLDRFTPDWEEKFPQALDQFIHELKIATKNATKAKDESNEYWVKYGSLARTSSMDKESIQRRHDFFVTKMLAKMAPLRRRDPQRAFTLEERELLYFASLKICAICGATVAWTEAEAHHRTPHTDGGITSLENADLVHRKCHPRGRSALGEEVPIGDYQNGQETDSSEIPWEVEYTNDE
jgi:hypothetical protein